MSTVAIIGSGLIGRAWAQVFARADWTVRVWDPQPAARTAARSQIGAGLRELAGHGLVRDPAAAEAHGSVCETLAEAVAGVDFVQENGPEILEVKQQTFAELDRHAPPAAILASSTSAIVASRFTESLAGRSRSQAACAALRPTIAPRPS